MQEATNKGKQLYFLTISRMQFAWIEQLAHKYEVTIRLMEEYCLTFGMGNKDSLIDLYNQIKGANFNTMRIDRKNTKLYLSQEKVEWMKQLRKLTVCRSDSKMIELCIMYARLNSTEFCFFVEHHIHRKEK